MDKSKHVQDIFKLAQSIGASIKPTVQQVVEEPVNRITTVAVEEAQEINNNLPTQYINTKGIMINADNVVTKTSFLSKLEVDHDKYAHLTFTPAEANRIQKSMNRLSTGASAVVPLRCNRAGLFIC